MSRPAETGARAHRSAPVPVLPSALAAAACRVCWGDPSRGFSLGGSVARLLAPQLRGRVSSRTLAVMGAKGLRVHRVGRAAYVHGPGLHWVFAVWDRGEEPPPFASRLGRASEGYRRRAERLARESRHEEMARIRGRFAGRLPWFRVRPVRAYRWDPEPRSWLELAAARAAGHNRQVRVSLGLEWPDNWYPEASGALEARALDGDR